MEPIDLEQRQRGLSALIDTLRPALPPEASPLNVSLWEGPGVWPLPELVLDVLESRAAELQDEWREPRDGIDYAAIQAFLASLYYDQLAATRIGLDFNLELREFERLFQPERYPALWAMFMTRPGDRGYELDAESHGFGYHIHYVDLARRRARTDVAFTFNPSEVPGPPNTLYWYRHGSYHVRVDPGAFGVRRRAAIHDCAEPFLHKVPKRHFLKPPKKSSILYP